MCQQTDKYDHVQSVNKKFLVKVEMVMDGHCTLMVNTIMCNIQTQMQTLGLSSV